MSALLMSGLVVAIMYVIFRFIEMRFILKENKPLKDIIRDTIVVYISTLAGIFIINQVNPLRNMASTVTGAVRNKPGAFIDEPQF